MFVLLILFFCVRILFLVSPCCVGLFGGFGGTSLPVQWEAQLPRPLTRLGKKGRTTFISPSPAPSCPSLSLSINTRKETGLTHSFLRYIKLLGKCKHKLLRPMMLRQPTWTLKRNQGRKSSQKKALFFSHGQILSLFLSHCHQHAAVFLEDHHSHYK